MPSPAVELLCRLALLIGALSAVTVLGAIGLHGLGKRARREGSRIAMLDEGTAVIVYVALGVMVIGFGVADVDLHGPRLVGVGLLAAAFFAAAWRSLLRVRRHRELSRRRGADDPAAPRPGQR